MKKIFALTACLLSTVMLEACSSNLTNKDNIIGLFEKNETVISESAESGDFEEVLKIKGIQDVYASEEYIDYKCGSSGMGSQTNYFGFYYSPDDNLDAWNGGFCSSDEDLIQDGKGYKWEETDGDNRYYVEQIGEHFFYYEAHF